jgi:hypothetical protein
MTRFFWRGIDENLTGAEHILAVLEAGLKHTLTGFDNKRVINTHEFPQSGTCNQLKFAVCAYYPSSCFYFQAAL